mmetsp:Transcript_7156/g.25531  ORF Transcript_7156/g.25531 Transcript_7156/m.25531 type:complete len:200 (-) Transcript_7156:1477-2076(-)
MGREAAAHAGARARGCRRRRRSRQRRNWHGGQMAPDGEGEKLEHKRSSRRRGASITVAIRSIAGSGRVVAAGGVVRSRWIMSSGSQRAATRRAAPGGKRAYIAISSDLSVGNLGEPRPVSGVQPVVAVKPYWQHVLEPGEPAAQLFSPLVIGWNASDEILYSAGLRKPSDDLPASMRAALMSVIMAPNTGVEADVPEPW